MSETLTKEDYYYDQSGFMVLTENYLLKRGSCCKNGCRHCPYGFVIDKTSSDYSKDIQNIKNTKNQNGENS